MFRGISVYITTQTIQARTSYPIVRLFSSLRNAVGEQKRQPILLHETPFIGQTVEHL